MLAVTCPHCRQKLSVKDSLAGQVANCPKCKGQIEIPTGESLDEITDFPPPIRNTLAGMIPPAPTPLREVKERERRFASNRQVIRTVTTILRIVVMGGFVIGIIAGAVMAYMGRGEFGVLVMFYTIAICLMARLQVALCDVLADISEMIEIRGV